MAASFMSEVPSKVVFFELTRRYLGFLPALERFLALG
jgi:hypothetical protein